MTIDRPTECLIGLVRELCKLSKETEWVEFKVNDAEPKELGEQISALANAAALTGKSSAYLVWGVADDGHAIVGTRFSPRSAKVGNEELENWILRLLTPKIQFRFFELTVDGQPVALLEIERAFRHPARFQGQEFIRVGSYKKGLKDFPEKERALWRIFDRMPFEERVAAERVGSDDVLRLLDYPAYFDLLGQPLPADRDGILDALKNDRLIRACDAGGWEIANLGAILFAKRLDDFRSLRRKAIFIPSSSSRRLTSRKRKTSPPRPMLIRPSWSASESLSEGLPFSTQVRSIFGNRLRDRRYTTQKFFSAFRESSSSRHHPESQWLQSCSTLSSRKRRSGVTISGVNNPRSPLIR